jgi:hypothetical protein
MKRFPGTRGEYIMWQRDTAKIQNGEVIFDNWTYKAPKRMKYDEAVEYYTKKLSAVWLQLGYHQPNYNANEESWKDAWHREMHKIRNLPLGMQNAMRSIFAEGYCCGFKDCKSKKGKT